jgi:hypothetical protein
MLPSLLVSLATVKFVALFRSRNDLDKVGHDSAPPLTSVGSIVQKFCCTKVKEKSCWPE